MIRGGLASVFRLAIKDLRHEWPVSIAVCLAITAVAAPALTLLALYAGLVGNLFGALSADPAAREIRLAATGQARFEPTWFEDVRNWPEVAFAAPATRYASAQITLFAPESGKDATASLIPTGRGDPTFPPTGLILSAPNQVGVSGSLAAKLGVKAGDAVEIEASRSQAGGGIETAVLQATVARIAADRDFARDALFVSPALLIQTEDFKNGDAAPLYQAVGPAPTARATFPAFRMYARDVASVAPLAAKLEAPPLSLTLITARSRIDFAQDLSSRLETLVAAIAGLGFVGIGGGLAAIQWSMAARRRRAIAILALIGFRRWQLAALPVAQAALLAAGSAVVTILVALLIGRLLDVALALDSDGASTQLEPGAVAVVVGAILVLSLAPAIWIGVGYSRLEPSNEIRET